MRFHGTYYNFVPTKSDVDHYEVGDVERQQNYEHKEDGIKT